MSHHKQFLPGSFVLGSQPVLDKDKLGRTISKMEAKPTLMLANGHVHGSSLLKLVPAWTPGQTLGTVSHWRNEAARRRADGDMTKADKKDLVQVPMYRGISARFANELRAESKREKKRQMWARIKQQIEAQFQKELGPKDKEFPLDNAA